MKLSDSAVVGECLEEQQLVVVTEAVLSLLWLITLQSLSQLSAYLALSLFLHMPI